MYDTNKILIKNGIREIISENEETFKNSISQALAMKLNTSIQTVRNEISKNILQNESCTKESEDITNFINVVESLVPGKFICKDGSNINITENDIIKIKNLFESLNPENRQKMAQEIFKSSIVIKNHLDFAQKSKELI